MTRLHGSRRSLMPVDEDVDTPLKCRERRRRRIEWRRRLAAVSDDATEENWESRKLAVADVENENSELWPSPSRSSSAKITRLTSDEETPIPPVYGLMTVVGRAREMEDEISIQMNFCRPEINGFRPVHFFAVFDGHGGPHVSALCKENMHVILEEELMRVKQTAERLTGGEVEELWKIAINRSFERMDEMAMTFCQCHGLESFKVCRNHPQLSLVGSTAVVSLLTQEYIIVANCGDSRAVLCRDGKAVPLSVDHKPDREDERARIEALGGRILFAGNGARVEGVLALSRAIGDRFLKQLVTSAPEFIFTKREAGDMSLILASDGLWDVLSSEMSCEVVHKCHQDLNPNLGAVGHMAVGGGGPLYPARTATEAAATLLVRVAIGRQSSDNISVIIVDLRN